jgi:hypothetical protein
MADAPQDAERSSINREDLLAQAGIPVTDEGREWAKRKLAEADAYWTPERWAELRAQLGFPTANPA